MNLNNFVQRLQALISEYPELAQHEMIVRNVQGTQNDLPELDADPPYWLGCVSSIDVDKYLSTESGTFFRSDYDNDDVDGFWFLLENWLPNVPHEGDYYDTTGLQNDEVRQRVDALPWEQAIVVDIGIV